MLYPLTHPCPLIIMAIIHASPILKRHWWILRFTSRHLKRDTGPIHRTRTSVELIILCLIHGVGCNIKMPYLAEVVVVIKGTLITVAARATL